MPSLTNALIGEYRLAESLGAGGMGEVYKAVHAHFGRVIAVKVLSPNLTDGPALQRFYNEADIQASLKHPSVAEYLGFYEYQGCPCILMEYVGGETLAAIIRQKGALSVPEAVQILRDVSAAIAHFHAQGVVHRDLKASNIKITESGQVKILDFGIARHQRSDRLTHLGAVVGTTESLAPEQVRGEAAGFPTDVWQLGVLFYELLTGNLPFQAGAAHEIYQRILSADYVPIRQLRPDVPEDIAKIVSHCLQKEPSRRYPTAAELHQALSASRQESGAQRQSKSGFAHDRRIWIAAAAILILFAGYWWLVRPYRNGNTVLEYAGTAAGIREEKTTSSPAANSAAAIKAITVDTMDGAAQVLQNEKPVGVTPFQIKAQIGENVNLVLRREGYEDFPVQFEVSERQVYTYILKPRKDR